MEARSQLRHRPTAKDTLGWEKSLATLFIVPQLLAIVKPGFQHIGSRNVLRNLWKFSILTVALLTMNFKPFHPLLALPVCFSTLLPAQITSAAAPVPYTSVSELNAILGPLQSAAQSAQANLGKLRIERWKVDSVYKKQTLANVDSLKRNLQGALPEIITQVQSAPEDLTATFKLYRNLDALYDVLGSVAETAGAFGSKDEFQSLSNDLNAIERSRRDLGERLQSLTASKEAEISQLRNQVRTLQASPPPAPKKVVVDDNEPKKPVVKKKPVPRPPKPAPPANQTPPASQAPPASQPSPQ